MLKLQRSATFVLYRMADSCVELAKAKGLGVLVDCTMLDETRQRLILTLGAQLMPYRCNQAPGVAVVFSGFQWPSLVTTTSAHTKHQCRGSCRHHK